MLTTTNVFLQRLLALRDEGFAQAERMQAEGRLDFGSYRTCLACAWCETDTAQQDGWRKTSDGFPRRENHTNATRSVCEYFDIDERDQWPWLFGVGPTLAYRRAYLDTLIAERLGVTA